MQILCAFVMGGLLKAGALVGHSDRGGLVQIYAAGWMVNRARSFFGRNVTIGEAAISKFEMPGNRWMASNTVRT
jgi:hypothetical protein